MRGKLALTIVAAACALCLALVGCGGGSATSSAESSAAPSESASSAATSEAASGAESSSAAESSAQAAEAASSVESAEDNHNSYFVGQWDLYESDEYTHEQVVQVMELYANDEENREQINEAYGRDNVEFCTRFNADGTGEMDTGAELISFTWEATNEGAITFTSFGGKETAIHIPVSDDKFTLNGDTYAKVS